MFFMDISYAALESIQSIAVIHTSYFGISCKLLRLIIFVSINIHYCAHFNEFYVIVRQFCCKSTFKVICQNVLTLDTEVNFEGLRCWYVFWKLISAFQFVSCHWVNGSLNHINEILRLALFSIAIYFWIWIG